MNVCEAHVHERANIFVVTKIDTKYAGFAVCFTTSIDQRPV